MWRRSHHVVRTGLVAHDLVVVQLGKHVAEGRVLGVLVDLRAPAHRDGLHQARRRVDDGQAVQVRLGERARRVGVVVQVVERGPGARLGERRLPVVVREA